MKRRNFLRNAGVATAEVAAKDEMSTKVYDSFIAFRDKSEKYAEVSSRAYLNARAL